MDKIYLALGGLWSDNLILNKDKESVLTVPADENPIREGMIFPVKGSQGESIDGIYDHGGDVFESQQDSITALMAIIQNIINWSLGLIGLIALVYLIYHGFLVVTAMGDDSKIKKGQKGIKTAVIAMVGIGSSRVIVSGILRFIRAMVSVA